MKISSLLLVPTRPEIEPYAARHGNSPETVITGIGLYRCAAATLDAVRRREPDLLVLCGIAGAYSGSGLKTGDTVLVGTEYAADLGSFSGSDFIPKFRERYDCPHTDGMPFPIVASNSVNAAGAPYADRSAAQIENMEGAAFFDVCLRENVPFLELRAISNTVGEDFSAWDFPCAAEALACAIERLTETLQAR